MRKEDDYTLLTNEDPTNDQTTVHHAISYLDNVPHIVSNKRQDRIQIYISSLYKLIIALYHQNIFRINPEKTTNMEFS